MSEWTKNPVKYQPIISKKGWWTLSLIAMVLTAILFLLQSSMPAGAETAAPAKTIYGFNFSQLLDPVGHLFEKLNNISPAVAIGNLAIIALWFFDQLFVKTVRR